MVPYEFKKNTVFTVVLTMFNVMENLLVLSLVFVACFASKRSVGDAAMCGA